MRYGRKRDAILVRITPARFGPLHTRESLDRGVYLRVGSTNRRADRELIDELRRFARGEAYDRQPMPGLDSEALDFRAASESFAPVRHLRRPDLHTLRSMTTHQDRNVPTIGGMLLFGVSRERHFPGRVDPSRPIPRRRQERGLVREVGTSPQDPKRRYFISS